MSRLAFVVAALVAAAAGAAERPVIAVVPFTGPQSRVAEATVVRALRKKATLVPPTAWLKSEKKLFAAARSAEDISAVAQDVGAQLVFTGVVKRDGRKWQLVLSVRDGKTGHSHDKLKYPLKGPRVTQSTLVLVTKEIADAFDHSLEAAGLAPAPTEPRPRATEPRPRTTEPRPRTTKTPPRVATNEEDDSDVEPETDDEPQPPPPPPKKHAVLAVDSSTRIRRARAGRPTSTSPSAARCRGAASTSIPRRSRASNRAWSAACASTRRFYPLAFTWRRAYGLIAGLGLGVTLDKPFWLDSTPTADPTQHFTTSELRVEGGLRWRLVLYKKLPRPELTILVGGGLHSFSISKNPDGSDVGPPDVAYKYATVGGGLRLYFAEWVSLWANFNYHVLTDTGHIESIDEFGPGSAFGLRVSGGLDFFVWRGLKLGVLGYYERFVLTFSGAGTPPPAKVASSATDQYFGGVLVVGYAY